MQIKVVSVILYDFNFVILILLKSCAYIISQCGTNCEWDFEQHCTINYEFASVIRKIARIGCSGDFRANLFIT